MEDLSILLLSLHQKSNGTAATANKDTAVVDEAVARVTKDVILPRKQEMLKKTNATMEKDNGGRRFTAMMMGDVVMAVNRREVSKTLIKLQRRLSKRYSEKLKMQHTASSEVTEASDQEGTDTQRSISPRNIEGESVEAVPVVASSSSSNSNKQSTENTQRPISPRNVDGESAEAVPVVASFSPSNSNKKGTDTQRSISPRNIDKESMKVVPVVASSSSSNSNKQSTENTQRPISPRNIDKESMEVVPVVASSSPSNSNSKGTDSSEHWESSLDGVSGKIFYYNTKTNVTQWEQPPKYKYKRSKSRTKSFFLNKNNSKKHS